jgi:hypothetical protein
MKRMLGMCLMFQVHDEHDGFKANAQHAIHEAHIVHALNT